MGVPRLRSGLVSLSLSEDEIEPSNIKMKNQKSELKEIVFLNDKFLSAHEAKISVLEPGFLYGWGLFETMRSYNNKIVYFAEHLKRIKNSCRLIDLRFPYPLAQLKKIIKKTIEINGFRDAYLRLTLWKSDQGTDTLITVKKYYPYPSLKYRQGFRVCICSFRQNKNSFLTRLKTTNYLFYQLAYAEAKKKKFDEALILNSLGYITEGSRSNIFLVKDNRLFTPALECGCLDGITRRVIFNLAQKYNIKLYAANFTVQDLYEADGAFFTNSLMGIMPLTFLGKHSVAKGLVDRLTKFFMKKYNILLKNGT